MSPNLPARPTVPWPAIVMMLLLATVVVLERAHTYREPIERDIAGYAVIAHEMRLGRNLYADLWDRKPPGLYVTFAAAERAVGYGRGEVMLLNLAAALATLGGCYVAGRAVGGATGGLVAAGLWAAVGGDLIAEANQPNAEVFVNAAMTAGFATVVRWPAGPSRPRWLAAVVGGSLFALATLYKHHAILAVAAVALGHVAAPGDDRFTWRRRLAESAVAAAVLALIWLAVLGHFDAAGRLGVTINVLFLEDLDYAGAGGNGGLLRNLVDGLRPGHLTPPAMWWAVGPLALVATVAIAAATVGASVRSRVRAVARPWWQWSLWTAGTAVVIAAPGYFHPHYYQLMMPPTCIAGGWAVATLLQAGDAGAWRWVARAVVVTALFGVVVRQGADYRLPADEWSRRKYFDTEFFENDFARQQQVGAQLAALLRPNETFWNLGDDTPLYFTSGKSPPTGLFYVDAFVTGADIPQHWATLMADLNRTRPDLIVVSMRTLPLFPRSAPVLPWMRANYAVANTGDLGRPSYRLFVRRGTDLYRRLNGATIPPATRPATAPVVRSGPVNQALRP